MHGNGVVGMSLTGPIKPIKLSIFCVGFLNPLIGVPEPINFWDENYLYTCQVPTYVSGVEGMGSKGLADPKFQ